MNNNNDSFIKPLNNNQITLHNLLNEYNIVLNQYEELLKNVNYDKDHYVQLKGRVFWGSYGLSQSSSNSVKDCENMCLNNKSCSGATFDLNKKFCYIRSGDGSISSGTENEYAIVSNYKYNLSNLQILNDKLIDLNQEINNLINNSDVYVKQLNNTKNIQQNELLNNYKILLDEKRKINEMIEEYEEIDKSYNDTHLVVERNNGIFNMWIILAIIVLIITLKIVFEIEVLFLGIIIVLIILTYLFTNPWGFFIWGLIIVIILYSKL